jgi:histone acetyltransferase (RNA polymerase elongator complex component)
VALVQALVESYVRDRGEPVRIAFLGGALPPEALLDAIAPRPFTVRVRPDLLDRAGAQRLAARGCRAVELDAWTLHEPALAACKRPYTARVVSQQVAGLAAFGLSAGIVLAPGLPATSHAIAVDDARAVAPHAAFARLHPVLVLEGSELQARWRSGAYVPLTLGEAVTTCRAVADVLEDAGVDVVRIGLQPGPDGLGHAVAGPSHPSLRQLVQARKQLRRLQHELRGTPAGSAVVVKCHPADETQTRGPLNAHVRTLRAELGLREVRIRADGAVARGELQVLVMPPRTHR